MTSLGFLKPSIPTKLLRCCDVSAQCFSGLSMPVGDKSCPFDEDRRRLAERRQRRFGFGNELAQSRFGAVDAEHADESGLAGGGVLAGLFADQCRIAFDVEKVVGDLERLADRRAVAFERRALGLIRRGEYAAGLAAEAQ